MSVAIHNQKLMNETAAAELLDVKPQTLRLWRMTDRVKLPYLRIGSMIRYRESDLLTYLEKSTVNPVG